VTVGYRGYRQLAGDEIVELLCLAWAQLTRCAVEQLDDLVCSVVDCRGGLGLAGVTASTLVPKLTALERDLKQYLAYYNFDRAHTGRLTRGKIPGEIVYGARKVRPR